MKVATQLNTTTPAISVELAALERGALFDRLANENRDATVGEHARLASLGRAIAYGQPRNHDEAKAQMAYVRECVELICEGAATDDEVRQYRVAMASAYAAGATIEP
jgi:hypothetical protein